MFTQAAPYNQKPFQLVQLLTLYLILVSFPPCTISAGNRVVCYGNACFSFAEKDFQSYQSKPLPDKLLNLIEYILKSDLAAYLFGNGANSGSQPTAPSKPVVLPNQNKPGVVPSQTTPVASPVFQGQCGVRKVGTPSRSKRAIRSRPGPNIITRSQAQSIVNRIVNGQLAQAGSWPWMAALGTRTSTYTVAWFCGGSLINPSTVITAAHCVQQQLPNLFVRLGGLKIDNNFQSSPPAVDILVTHVLTHEQYYVDTAGITHNDIALLRLERAAPLSNYIQPICLAPSSDVGRAGEVGLIAGWGRTVYGGQQSPNLLEAFVPIVEDSRCKYSYGQTMTSSILCAGGHGQDTCQGDSGGPLVAVRGSYHYLVGLTSFGRICGDPNSPAAFTRVSQYLAWIQRHLTGLGQYAG